MTSKLRVLLVEDNLADVELIREALSGAGRFEIESVPRLTTALGQLDRGGIDLLLVDLGLPDSQGLDTFRRLQHAAPRIPVIVLTGNVDQDLAVAAVREGAQDFLVKGHIVGNLLERAARYAVERKRAEDRERLARGLLELLNRPEVAADVLREILQLVKKSTGLEAVGIRLRDGDDFPYHETNGFEEAHLLAECSLCGRDAAGNLIRDAEGNPVLEGLCGSVLRGRTDPTLPFYTKGGSFWTNSTTQLHAAPAEADRQIRTRDRCTAEGYESVALIPLRSGTETIGLLQLNDRRPDRFTLGMIRFFEGLGASIGIALSRKQAEEAVGSAGAFLLGVIDKIADPVFVKDDKRRFVLVNDALCTMVGRSRADLLGRDGDDWFPAEQVAVFREMDAKVLGTGDENVNEESLSNLSTGEVRAVVTRKTRYIDPLGKRFLIGVIRDFTERKRAEGEIKRQLAELQRWQDVMLGRADRAQELKREVNDLCRRVGEPVRYPSQEAGPADSGAAPPRS
jgi:PAS domain S-box-containing protein